LRQYVRFVLLRFPIWGSPDARRGCSGLSLTSPSHAISSLRRCFLSLSSEILSSPLSCISRCFPINIPNTPLSSVKIFIRMLPSTTTWAMVSGGPSPRGDAPSASRSCIPTRWPTCASRLTLGLRSLNFDSPTVIIGITCLWNA
jgi:hypothetical protein